MSTMSRDDAVAKVLAPLNESQMQAVTADASQPLQIIAGPGTGKTTVLVSRVAYLLLKGDFQAHEIMLTTFTKKASVELSERLVRMIPPGLGINTSRVVVGTFHSFCYRLLKTHGSQIGVPNDFKVADGKDCKQVLASILDDLSPELAELKDSVEEARKLNLQGPYDVLLLKENDKDAAVVAEPKHNGYDPKKILNLISSLKSQGHTHERYSLDPTKSLELSHIYTQYQHLLSQARLLDFGDLILGAIALLSRTSCLSHFKHILVDEFQDTDAAQLDLAKQIIAQSRWNPRGITIVGDPDQSIYMFRNAVVENFEHMQRNFGGEVNVVRLDQNYRSIRSVLATSERLMTQQENRTPANLKSRHECEFRAVYNRFMSNKDEARFIAEEISLLSRLKGLFEFDDFAILLRSRPLCRQIELELSRMNIPYEISQGKPFWDHAEISVMLDYMRCLVDENDYLAILRVINVPKRGFGPQTLKLLDSKIRHYLDHGANSCTVHQHLQSLDESDGLSKGNIEGLKTFFSVITEARSRLDQGGPDEMIDYLAVEIGIAGHEERAEGKTESKKRRQDEETTDTSAKKKKNEADGNLTRLKSLVSGFEPQEVGIPFDISESEAGPTDANYTEIEKVARFLEEYNLSVGDKKETGEDGEKKRKVAITTVHGAKGLEWPVVFIPGITEDFFPAAWALDIDDSKLPKVLPEQSKKKKIELLDEERRVCYVAMTRAKVSMYLSGFASGPFGYKKLSEPEFVKGLKGLCHDRNEALSSMSAVKDLYTLSAKAFPEDAENSLEYALDRYHDFHNLGKVLEDGERQQDNGAHMSRTDRGAYSNEPFMNARGLVSGSRSKKAFGTAPKSTRQSTISNLNPPRRRYWQGTAGPEDKSLGVFSSANSGAPKFAPPPVAKRPKAAASKAPAYTYNRADVRKH